MNCREVGRIRRVACIILVCAAPVSAQPVFRAAPKYVLPGSIDTTLYVSALAVADVGSPEGPPDGVLDLVTANTNQAAPVLFGKPDGSFTPGPSNSIGTIPTALVVADFDKDGGQDLLVADAREVRFLKGKKDGTFQAAGPPVSAGRGPAAIAVADVNKDNKLDAIVADDGDQGRGAVAVLLGNGDGTFAAPAIFTTGLATSAVTVGDFNGDGKLDLAATNAGDNSVSTLFGDGTGGFTNSQTLVTGEEPVAIGAQDLNGDGRLDLVVVNRNSDNIAVFDGRANGQFADARFFESGSEGSTPNALAFADFNRDGHVDVVVSNNRSNDASVLLGDGHGGFSASRGFITDQEPLAVATADFNGDHLADVVTIDRGSQNPNAAVLLGTGDGSLAGVENVVTPPNPNAVGAGDFDNDGIADFVIAQSTGGSGLLFIYRSDPSVGFATPQVLQSAGDATSVAQGDFNADGQLDLAALNKSTNNVSIFLGHATGFAPRKDYPVGVGAAAIVAGDWNGDGRTDLAVARQGTGSTGAVDIIVANADGSFGSATSTPAGGSPSSLDTGDFNGDGKADLIVANSGTNDLSVLIGSGTGTFQPGTPVTGVSSPRAVTVADFDRDGFDDVAVAQSVGLNVVVLYGNGHGGFPARGQPLGVRGSPSGVAARDLTGDLVPDIMVTDQVSNVVATFVGTGATRQFRDGDFSVSRGPVSITAADFDDDGRYDAAAANGLGPVGTVSVLTNIRATPITRGDGNGDRKVSVADTVAVMRKLSDGTATRVEDVARGAYAAAAGADANGDGLITVQDARAVAHRLFSRM